MFLVDLVLNRKIHISLKSPPICFSSDCQPAIKQIRGLYVVTIVINVTVHKRKLNNLRYISPRETEKQFYIILTTSFVTMGNKRQITPLSVQVFSHLFLKINRELSRN